MVRYDDTLETENASVNVVGNNVIKSGYKLQVELAVLKELNHPSIITILDVDMDHDKRLILTFPLYHPIVQARDRPNMVSIIDGNLNVLQRRGLFYDIEDALYYLASQRFSHNNVKPDNIVYDPLGDRYILIDFETASLAFLTGSAITLAPEIGTEALMGKFLSSGGLQSDLFSLGVTMLLLSQEMLVPKFLPASYCNYLHFFYRKQWNSSKDPLLWLYENYLEPHPECRIVKPIRIILLPDMTRPLFSYKSQKLTILNPIPIIAVNEIDSYFDKLPLELIEIIMNKLTILEKCHLLSILKESMRITFVAKLFANIEKGASYQSIPFQSSKFTVNFSSFENSELTFSPDFDNVLIQRTILAKILDLCSRISCYYFSKFTNNLVHCSDLGKVVYYCILLSIKIIFPSCQFHDHFKHSFWMMKQLNKILFHFYG